ncbi:MAG TPA: glutathione S-transferase family protein [Xanthobacteraceae bacterium]|nr:glutathione S-transferase family protein [Xanthobacteraceae bacterium]
MSIEIFAVPPSPRAFKVIALANHLGIDIAIRRLDFFKGEHKTPEYAALNPNMLMPTLRDGDYVLWEANAIMQYLAGKKPESGLLPREERGRLDVTRWQFWDLAHWDPAVAILLIEKFVKPKILGVDDIDQAAIVRGTEQFHRAATVLDGHLEGRNYVSGDTLTLADFALGAPLNYAGEGCFPLAPYGEIRRWHAGLMALPAWQKTVAESAPHPVGAAAAA